MTTYVLAPCGFGAGAQFFDGDGQPLAGGKIHTYLAGTVTPTDTWTSHLAPSVLNSNPIILDADGRVVEEIWTDLDLAYKFVLTDQFDVQIWEKDYLSVYSTPPYVPPAIVPQITTVWDFMTPAMIADVKARTYLIDCTAAIIAGTQYVANQSSVASKPLGVLLFPAGGYKITNQIQITAPILWQGAGQGGQFTTPPTEIRWMGGPTAGEMVRFGVPGNGVPFQGGGICRMALNGLENCASLLYIRNARVFEFTDLYLFGATVTALVLITPTYQTDNPSGFGMFRNIFINQFCNFSTNNNRAANGIHIKSEIPASAGAIACVWDSVFITHTDGAGVLVDGGNNHHWTKLMTFRNDARLGPPVVAVGTGPGVWFANVWDGVINEKPEGAHMFLNATCTAGVRVDDPSDTNDAIFFLNFDDTSISGATSFYGAGANRIHATTHSGRVMGMFKVHSFRETIHHDGMVFMGHAAATLTTTHGSWATSAAAVVDAAAIGGGVLISTTNVINNIAYITNCRTMGVSGVPPFLLNPHLVFSVVTTANTGVIHRWGFMNSITDPPTHGAFIEMNDAVYPGYYRCAVADTGVVTYLDVPRYAFAAVGDLAQFRIELNGSAASFYARLNGRSFTFIGSMTPPPINSLLDVAFWTKTTAAAVQSLAVHDYKLGHLTEYSTA